MTYPPFKQQRLPAMILSQSSGRNKRSRHIRKRFCFRSCAGFCLPYSTPSALNTASSIENFFEFPKHCFGNSLRENPTRCFGFRMSLLRLRFRGRIICNSCESKIRMNAAFTKLRRQNLHGAYERCNGSTIRACTSGWHSAGTRAKSCVLRVKAT